MRKRQWLKTMVASLLTTAALILPMTLMADVIPSANLRFEGAQLVPWADGSVQMIFTVYAENVALCDGASFTLQYNEKYLFPSDYATNQKIIDQGEKDTDQFFRVDPTLYGEKGSDGAYINPFRQTVQANITKPPIYYSNMNLPAHQIKMQLWLKQEDLLEKGKLKKVTIGEGKEPYMVFDSSKEKVALGTVSFRVTDKKFLPEIIAQFGKILNTEDPTEAGNYLVNVRPAKASPGAELDRWSIGRLTEVGQKGRHEFYVPPATSGETTVGLRNTKALFTFQFPKTVVAVEAAQAQLTVNAYQNYTKGTAPDLPITLGKFSPMVTATYADGTKENFVFPWGNTATGKYTLGTGSTAPYAATGGHYFPTQYFTYQNTEVTPAVTVTFPVPVVVDMTVAPITLLSVAADHLSHTYLVKNVLREVQSGADLKLPEEAYLVTDIVPAGASLTVPVPGWSPTRVGSAWPKADGTNAATMMNVLKADTPPSTAYWPDDADAGFLTSNPEKFVGDYTFTMASTFGGAPVAFAKATLTGRYPWLTVPNASYSLQNAVRHLRSDPADVTLAEGYNVSDLGTVTHANGHPTLNLKVEPTNPTTTTMLPGSKFRVKLPNGVVMGTGTEGNLAEDWFADETTTIGFYTATEQKNTSNMTSFALAANPGITYGPGQGTDYAQRESLRRYINLGGWFAVSVNENPDGGIPDLWSDFIPVYVAPRKNLYLEDKTYNFLGNNAALCSWSGGLGKTVPLPHGDYGVVNENGQPVYIDCVSGLDTISPQTMVGTTLTDNLPKKESYGYKTTYDGATGGEPGRLHTLKVTGGAAWTSPTTSTGPAGTPTDGKTITKYGPDPLLDGAYFGGFGRVNQVAPAKNATVRTQLADKPTQVEKITLTCESPTGISHHPDGNVSLVTYDTRTEGYTVRQDYTLTIKNVGTTDIYGLDVDSLTGGTPPKGGGHFEMLQAPASFLAPGESTTFVLTYVFNLQADGAKAKDYRDTLYITSTSRPTAAAGNPATYLLDFDAALSVSGSRVHKVTVVTKPGDGTLGVAGLILGEGKGPGGQVMMDYTPASSTYAGDATVTVMVQPTDEYKVKTITCVDTSGGVTTLTPYNPDGTNPAAAALKDGTLVYTFKMPSYDTTVTVEFYEDILSKLRLSDLIDFSAPLAADLKQTAADTVAPQHTYPVVEKAFTAQEGTDADNWANGAGGTVADQRDLYLMTVGAGMKKAADHRFRPSGNQYLVVIPYDADFSQVQCTLRKVAYGSIDGTANPDIAPFITMERYEKSPVGTPPGTANTILAPTPGNTAIPTVHFSDTFPSPAAGQSSFVRVTLSPTEGCFTTSRYYYLEIHRTPQTVTHEMGYGNSPYGMIMNHPKLVVPGDPAQTAKNQAAAKADFVAHNYNFTGMTPIYIPDAVTRGSIAGVTYWREAWVKNGMAYEPESGLGVGDPLVYTEGDNLDLNDDAFFAILGEGMIDPGLRSALDSSGRPVDLNKVHLSMEIVQLDASPLATTQAWRFTGYDPATAGPAGKETLTPGLAGGTFTAAGWTSKTVPDVDPLTGLQKKDGDGNLLFVQEPVPNIRPGRYVMEYSFEDYDGETVLRVGRPCVVLAPTGDVNADLVIQNGHTAGDEAVLENRVADPLGFDAPGYPDGNIYKFRTCDVNNDRNVNNIDANVLKKSTTGLIRFYLPTDYKG